MIRKSLIVLLFFCATVASAQASVQGVIGEGIAVNADRKEGEKREGN